MMDKNGAEDIEIVMTGKKRQEKGNSEETAPPGFRSADIGRDDLWDLPAEEAGHSGESDPVAPRERQPAVKPTKQNTGKFHFPGQMQGDWDSYRDQHEADTRPTRAKDSWNGKETDQCEEQNQKGRTIRRVVGILAGAVAMAAGILLVLFLLPCKHEWAEATCTTAKTCSECGATEGEALGHIWEEATCIAPKTCSRCNETQGNAIGHKWTEKTDYDCVNSTVLKYSVCSACNAEANQKSYALTTLLDDTSRSFRVSPYEFMQRLNIVYRNMYGNPGFVCSWTDETGMIGDPGIDIKTKDGITVASIQFEPKSGAETFPAEDKDKASSFNSMLVISDDQYYERLALVLYGVIMACDLSENNYEKLEVASMMLADAVEGVVRDDLVYYLTALNDLLTLLMITPVNLLQ